MKYTILTHYAKKEKNQLGDYYYVTIHKGAKKEPIMKTYGDQYHDQGKEKAQGFKDAVMIYEPDAIFEYKNVWDVE